ncbi:MAG TPA: hypothetical protein DEF59_03275 [Candidatus Magasanikbacteria bacterium]|nr:hypothetical protein [Candidatus Magasanikbacteria bacterium]
MTKQILSAVFIVFCLVFFISSADPVKAAICCEFKSTCGLFSDTDSQACLEGGGSPQADSKCVGKKCISNSASGESDSSPSIGNYGLDSTANAAGLKKSGTIAGITGSIVGVVLSLVGVAFFLLMLYGGFLWMTARGDETQAKKAKDIIIDAVIGIIIVAAAGIITSFVFTQVVPK